MTLKLAQLLAELDEGMLQLFEAHKKELSIFIKIEMRGLHKKLKDIKKLFIEYLEQQEKN